MCYICIFTSRFPHAGHKGFNFEPPPVSIVHTESAQFFGALMWIWIGYRAYIDGPVELLVRIGKV